MHDYCQQERCLAPILIPKEASDLHVEHVKSQMKTGKYKVCNKFHCSASEQPSLRQKAEGIRYIGQTGQSAKDRNNANSFQEM